MQVSDLPVALQNIDPKHRPFVWWLGVVEDVADPLQLGRCRVRIVGFHTDARAVLPHSDLPWAVPLQSVTSTAMSGIGTSPTGILPGTWVLGFFLDGSQGQQPVFVGTLAGHPEESPSSNLGFSDPSGTYPLPGRLGESDIPRLARGTTKGTVVETETSQRTVEVPTISGSWDQPSPSYAAQYPSNHVMSSQSGHVVEIDDTPGHERVHIAHRSGSHLELRPDGSVILKAQGDQYRLVAGSEKVSVEGTCQITVTGKAEILGLSDVAVHARGQLHLTSDTRVLVQAPRVDINP